MKKIYLKSYTLNVAKGLNYLYEEIKKEGGYMASSYKTKMEKIELINYESKKKETESYFGEWLFITFILNNEYYYVSFDENQFFEDNYTKQSVVNNTISRDVYMNNIPKIFFKYKMTDEEIKKASKNLLEWLKNQKYSKKHREYKRQRIYNLYDDGYHYEKIPVRERIEKIHKIEEA